MMKTMFESVNDFGIEGLKQAASDELSDSLLAFAKKSFGKTHPLLETEAGQDVAKCLVAFAVMLVGNQMLAMKKKKKDEEYEYEEDEDEEDEDYTLFEQFAYLQLQTTVMRLTQPHMKQLKSLTKKVMKEFPSS